MWADIQMDRWKGRLEDGVFTSTDADFKELVDAVIDADKVTWVGWHPNAMVTKARAIVRIIGGSVVDSSPQIYYITEEGKELEY
jgi:hypothetical protein